MSEQDPTTARQRVQCLLDVSGQLAARLDAQGCYKRRPWWIPHDVFRGLTRNEPASCRTLRWELGRSINLAQSYHWACLDEKNWDRTLECDEMLPILEVTTRHEFPNCVPCQTDHK